MGYSMHLDHAGFDLDMAHERDMVLAARALADQHDHIRWVDKAELREATTIKEVFSAFGWRIRIDIDRAVRDVLFEGEKLGDEDLFFGAIAPWVASGSYIEMVGEDGDRWRWVFDGVTVKQVQPKVSWE